MTTLKIEQVSRTFPARHGNAPTRALEPTDLTIGNNDFVTILGPSGCGKSTLLRIVADLVAPTTGQVSVFGMTDAPVSIRIPPATLGQHTQEVLAEVAQARATAAE